VLLVQLLSMAANKTENEFAIELGLTKDDLVDAFEEHLAKKPKDESGSEASTASGASSGSATSVLTRLSKTIFNTLRVQCRQSCLQHSAGI
jgi:hypothetical protein